MFHVKQFSLPIPGSLGKYAVDTGQNLKNSTTKMTPMDISRHPFTDIRPRVMRCCFSQECNRQIAVNADAHIIY